MVPELDSVLDGRVEVKVKGVAMVSKEHIQ